MSELVNIVIGAGGHSRSVIDCMKKNSLPVEAVFDVDFKSGTDEKILSIEVKGSVEDFLKTYSDSNINVYLALGANKKRKEMFLDLKGKGYNLPSLKHPSAIMGEGSTIGDGVFLGAGSVLGAMATLGDNVIVNSNSLVEHECNIGSHSHLCPMVSIAGRCSIGENTFIGIGATVIDGIVIGKDVVVGAGGVVIADIEAGNKVVGVPAR